MAAHTIDIDKAVSRGPLAANSDPRLLIRTTSSAEYMLPNDEVKQTQGVSDDSGG